MSHRIRWSSSVTCPDFAGCCLDIAQCISAGSLGARAVDDIATCLEPLRTSAWPDVAWRASRLTTDGFPVEFAFSNRDDRLRMTFEPAGPECDERQKLDRAIDLLARLGGPAIPISEVGRWKALQNEAPLRWGAWFGLRQAGEHLNAKLYIEIPRGSLIPQEWRHPIGFELVMLGHEPAAGRTEYYYALRDTGAAQLSQSLRHLGHAVSKAALDALTDCTGLPLESLMRFTGVGLSRATTTTSIPIPGVTLFFRGMFTTRLRLRRLLVSAAHATNRPHSSYERLIATLGDDELPDHGVISVTPHGDATVEIRAGLSGIGLFRAPCRGPAFQNA